MQTRAYLGYTGTMKTNGRILTVDEALEQLLRAWKYESVPSFRNAESLIAEGVMRQSPPDARNPFTWQREIDAALKSLGKDIDAALMDHEQMLFMGEWEDTAPDLPKEDDSYVQFATNMR